MAIQMELGCEKVRIQKMRRLLVAVIIVLSGGVILLIGNAARTSASSPLIEQQIPKESKEQPKKIKLDTDSLDDKWGEVAFDHESHTIKNYTPDGKTTGTCVECHHTDQPKEKLTPPLVTSERNVSLTSDGLKDAAASPFKGCRSSHLQPGGDSKLLPSIKNDARRLK